MKKIITLLCAATLFCGCSAPSEPANSGGYYELSNKSIGWGLKKNKGAPPEVPKSLEDMLKEHNSFYIGDIEKKQIYLTFDEGYENGYTDDILDILKQKQVPAAFFITGDYFERSGDLVQRMVEEGHIVGNHTYYHHNLPNLAEPDKIAAELNILQEKFTQKFGTSMKYTRPPEGRYSERVLAVAADLGYRTAFWSFAYKDWIADNVRGADYAVSQIVPYFHNGMVLLLHAVSPDNAAALAAVIDKAREQGYEFASLDEL